MRNYTKLLMAVFLLAPIGLIGASIDNLRVTYKHYTAPGKWEIVTYNGDINSIPSNLEEISVFVRGRLSSGKSQVVGIWKKNGQTVGRTSYATSQTGSVNLTGTTPTGQYQTAKVRFSPGSYSVEVLVNGRSIGSINFGFK
jgi:hypothetical protein